VFFNLCHAVKHHIYSQGNESLINCRLLKSITGNSGRLVYVIEQTDLFQKFGKTMAQKYEFVKKIKKI